MTASTMPLEQMQRLGYVSAGAVFNAARTHRYHLHRAWADDTAQKGVDG